MIDWLTNVTVLVTDSPHLPTKTHSGDDWLTNVTVLVTGSPHLPTKTFSNDDWLTAA